MPFDGVHTVFMGHRIICRFRSQDVLIRLCPGAVMANSWYRHKWKCRAEPHTTKETPAWKLTAFAHAERILDGTVDEFHLPGIVDA